MTDDLAPEALLADVPGRPVRSYPAVLSTEAAARAWAREGAPAGAVVVADYQASARGRGGLPWTCRPGRDLGFTLVLRPALAPDDEGWLYIAAATAVLDVLGGSASVRWPDGIERDGRHLADVAGHAGLGSAGVAWAVVNVLVLDAPIPRGRLLARLATAIEDRQEPRSDVLAGYGERCTTLGREVVAHLIPAWPDGVQISGRAAAVREDGSLVIEQADGRRISVRPQHLARIEAD
jgi:BirA family transcriptional regulator, biotin operon repressor / biotin---[acetyl-CoA-carboxylase] ligase